MMSLVFNNNWPVTWGLLLAAGLGLLGWLLSRREARQTTRPWSWLLPLLRGLSITLLALTLMEPTVRHLSMEGQPSKLVFAIDASQSMQLFDHSKDVPNKLSRFERAASALIGPTPSTEEANSAEGTADEPTAQSEPGLLEELADRFDIVVHRIDQAGTTPLLWDLRAVKADKATRLTAAKPQQFSPTTSIGDALVNLAQVYGSDTSTQHTMLVLMSDGQSNAGMPSLTAAEQLASQDLPLFTVGYGSSEESTDVALLATRLPEQVFAEETLAGTLTVRERTPVGDPYRLEIYFESQLLWETEIVSQSEQQREIPFTFPVRKILETAQSRQSRDVDFAVLPVKLEVQLQYDLDSQSANDRASCFTSISVQKSRVLLLDGRSRWETRYLKNLLQRDAAWELTACIGNPNTTDLPPNFPDSREKLFKYDLMILGEVDPELLGSQRLMWIKEFVADRAGGLVICDGNRGHLRDPGYQPLSEVFPIRWLASRQSRLECRAVPTASGSALQALQLAEDMGSFWPQLSPLQNVAMVTALPGAEILLEAENTVGRSPLLVYRQFGAGRVLYLASDDLWRWRFKAPDGVHTRLWNQLAKWIMDRPLNVQGEFVSLDSGAARYFPDETIEIRCQLRDNNGKPQSAVAATAVVSRVSDNGDLESPIRYPLQSSKIAGSYQTTLEGLPEGDYQVQIEAPGFSRDALDVATGFTVALDSSDEYRHADCQESLLRVIAEETGGEYFPEADLRSLVSHLKPLSHGQYNLNLTPIWPTFTWFTVAIALLSLEWLLRKRAGLV